MIIKHYNANIPCPVGWTQGFLADFIEESSERNRARLDLPVYSVTNTRGFVPQVEQFARNIHSKDTVNYKVFRRGHFGFNPSRINVGSIALNDVVDAGLLSPMYVVFVTKDILHSSYLKHYIETYDFRRNVLNGTAGTVRESLNFSAFQAFAFQFPTSRSEQVRIAEILSAVDQTIEQTEAMIAKQQHIKTGLMQDLLTRGIDEHGNLRSEQTHKFKDSPLGRIPVSWEARPIEQKLDRIIDYRGRTPKKVEAGIPLLTAKNVREGYLDEAPREFIAEDAFETWMTRGIPSPGDVLFTTEAPMGNVARVPHYRIALAQRLLTLCPKRAELSNDYLFWMLHWSRTKERLELLTSGSTVVGVKQSVFRKVLFRFPELKEQESVTRILNSHDESCANLKRHLEKLYSIKTAIMQDLLTGRRRVTSLLSESSEATA